MQYSEMLQGPDRLRGPLSLDPPPDTRLGTRDRSAAQDSDPADDRELHGDKDYRLSVVQVRCRRALALERCILCVAILAV